MENEPIVYDEPFKAIKSENEIRFQMALEAILCVDNTIQSKSIARSALNVVIKDKKD